MFTFSEFLVYLDGEYIPAYKGWCKIHRIDLTKKRTAYEQMFMMMSVFKHIQERENKIKGTK